MKGFLCEAVQYTQSVFFLFHTFSFSLSFLFVFLSQTLPTLYVACLQSELVRLQWWCLVGKPRPLMGQKESITNSPMKQELRASERKVVVCSGGLLTFEKIPDAWLLLGNDGTNILSVPLELEEGRFETFWKRGLSWEMSKTIQWIGA